MKVYVIARENSQMKDWELQIINSFQRGPKHEYDPGPLTPEIAEQVMTTFEKLYPDKCSWHISIERELSV